jgi:hypothetical protein
VGGETVTRDRDNRAFNSGMWRAMMARLRRAREARSPGAEAS